jgi:hypothetical protein
LKKHLNIPELKVRNSKTSRLALYGSSLYIHIVAYAKKNTEFLFQASKADVPPCCVVLG